MHEVLVALSGIWLMLPALLPNSAAVIFGGGPPVDFGRSIGGRRILGDGKTWLGFVGGVSAGIAIGTLQMMLAFIDDPVNFWGFGPFPEGMMIIATLSLGSLLGDMGGSFLKRRLGMERGRRMPGLDQYDFLIGAILLVLLFHPQWFIDNFIEGESLIALVTLLVVTPILHKAVNIIGYRMGKKEVPW